MDTDTSLFSPPPSDLEQQSPPSVPVLEVPSPRRRRGIFSTPLYTAKDYFDRASPTNVLKCLELDQLSLQRPLLYREQYLNNGLATTGHMHTTDIRGHHGCVNAISFSNLGEEFLATGGDDERVLVWKVADAIQGKQLKPMAMTTSHQSNVFSAVFSCDNSFIYSGGNDGDVVQHDFASGRMVNIYPHPDAVYSVAAHPLSPNIILTASEDGFVRIIDTRMPRLTLDMVLEGRLGQCAYQTVAINPVEPRLVAIGSTRNGAELYDTQERKRVIRYNPTRWIVSQEDVVSVCFNNSGTQLFTMLRQLPPCLYDIWNKEAKCLFIDNNGAYRNSVTMKSGCFLGLRDEYVVSGSDDFRIYIWKIPDGKPVGPLPVVQEVMPHLILPGHRSIVNQIRYSPTHRIMCSSGVEKVVKLWSHLPLFAKDEVQYSGHPPSRRKYTRLEFIRITIDEDEHGDGSADPLQEDQQVLAFFDNLVDQDDRDITNLLSSSSEDFSTSSSLSSDQSDSSPMAYSTHIHWIDLPSSSPWSAQSTPQSLSPANTSSLEPPWSDLEEREWWDSESSDRGGSGESKDETKCGDEKDDEFKRSGNSSETCIKNGTESRMSLEVLASSSSKGGAQAESRKRGASSQSKRSKKSGSKSYTKEFFLKTVPPSKFYSSHSQDLTSHPGPSSGATCLVNHPGPSSGATCLTSHPGPSSGATCLVNHPGPSSGATCLASHPGPSSGATCLVNHPGPSSGATCLVSHPGPSSGATCLNEDTREQNHKSECSVSVREDLIVDSRNVGSSSHLQENGKTSDSLTGQDVDEDKLNSAHSTSIS